MDIKSFFGLDANLDNLFQIITQRDEMFLDLGLNVADDNDNAKILGSKANVILVTYETLIERYVARYYKGNDYNINDIFLGNVEIPSSKINYLLGKRKELLETIDRLPNAMPDVMDPQIRQKREIVSLEVLAKVFAQELFPNEELTYSQIVDRTYDAIFKEKGAIK